MPLNDQLMQITRTSDSTWDSNAVLSVSFATLQLPRETSNNSVTLRKYLFFIETYNYIWRYFGSLSLNIKYKYEFSFV